MLQLFRRRPSSILRRAHERLRRGLRIDHSPQAQNLFRILFLGRDEFSCSVFRKLFEAKEGLWEDIAVATQPNTYIGRDRSTLSVPPLSSLAAQYGVTVHRIPELKRDFKTWQIPPPFDEPSPSNVLITASFGRILTDSMLDRFEPTKLLNVHPSSLPRYRGPSPIQHAIMNNDKDIGVSVIQMTKKREGIDAGPIWASDSKLLGSGQRYEEVERVIGQVGGTLLVSTLRNMLTGEAISTPQSTDGVSYAPMLSLGDWQINFETMTALEIVQRAAALDHKRSLWAQTTSGRRVQLSDFKLGNQTCLIKTKPEHPNLEPGKAFWSSTKRIYVVCGDQSLLGIKYLQRDGKKRQTAMEYWDAYHKKSPDTLEFRFQQPQ